MGGKTEVLVVGAGASGLTLACDLQRRGVNYRIVEAAARGFEGSRAKGVQPRSLEVFDDLGALPRLESRAMLYPPLGVHLGPLSIRRTMIKRHEPTPDVPHANTLLIPQYATDASLRERLEELGGRIEYGTRLVSLVQDDAGVTANVVNGDGAEEEIRARYLVGADGGGSTVRRGVGIRFEGATDESDRMIVADLEVRGLSRDRWHIWPRLKGRFVALCPLPDGPFQLMLKLRAGDAAEFDTAAVHELAKTVLRSTRVQVDRVLWSSVWRPNTRLAEHYQAGRVFLVGDAAHVHPPTGAQGLNTGVQDAYNLGWKLGQVLAGAPNTLLDSYEAERQPVAARVLGLATGLYAQMGDRPLAATKRGDEERQLLLSYRGGPLGSEQGEPPAGVGAGDRAPDSPYLDATGERSTLFDAFRGPHFTVIVIGGRAIEAATRIQWPTAGAEVKVLALDGDNATWRQVYGVDSDAAVLVRPDGYVAAVIRPPFDALPSLLNLPLFPRTAAA
ncbi:FAD-dependent monooxygenase [Micromonospora sp. RTGN7]|uniref:FAD-dependent monooxygenase n=1 Tax=Micromonospora sp. RTGN7 TaxID=3016526 RepID=UPI0029FEFC01|nr:FAD-dependent monooxygenase [Micromonospora sp. RTGN7]